MTRHTLPLLGLLLTSLLLCGCRQGPDPGASLSFVERGETLSSLSLGTLLEGVPSEQWTAFDPYYGREKTWRALPLHPVLEAGFGRQVATMQDVEFVLRAVDGYTVPISGARLLVPGAYVAFEDVEVADWEPIGPQKAHPGPFYLVWRGSDQQDLKEYPRPWQLAAIEIAPFASLFPHTIPVGEPEDSPAMLGFKVFKRECLKCHAINREGGHVGPELNLPQSIVEYRPKAQIKAYIKDPSTFRYGGMPAHRHLSDAQLDGLVAYFEAMSTRKHDPSVKGAKGNAPGGAH